MRRENNLFFLQCSHMFYDNKIKTKVHERSSVFRYQENKKPVYSSFQNIKNLAVLTFLCYKSNYKLENFASK